MLTFNNDPKKKQARIRRAKRHLANDQLSQGTYMREGSGCSVGCDVFDITGEQPDQVYCDLHVIVAAHDGVPVWLEHVRDCVFEGLSVQDARDWHLDLAKAIPVGMSLGISFRQFIAWLFKPNGGLLSELITKAEDRSFKSQVEMTYRLLDRAHNLSNVSAAELLQAAHTLEKASDRRSKSKAWMCSQQPRQEVLVAASRSCVLFFGMKTGDVDGLTVQRIIKDVCRAASRGYVEADTETHAIYAKVAKKLISLISGPDP